MIILEMTVGTKKIREERFSVKHKIIGAPAVSVSAAATLGLRVMSTSPTLGGGHCLKIKSFKN